MGEMNDKRAHWAEVALRAFMAETGQADEVEALGDLLGDFMHWCDRHRDELTDEGVADEAVLTFGEDLGGHELLATLMERGQGYYIEEEQDDE